MLGYARKGKVAMSAARTKLVIPSVEVLKRETTQDAAWSRTKSFRQEVLNRVVHTRAVAQGKVGIPHNTTLQSFDYAERTVWNELPEEVKLMQDRKAVKNWQRSNRWYSVCH